MSASEPHHDLFLLLPFYVNGTMDDTDRARIDAALKTSPDLREELAEVQALADLVRRSGAAIAAEGSAAEFRPLPAPAPAPAPASVSGPASLAAVARQDFTRFRPHRRILKTTPGLRQRVVRLARPARWHAAAAAVLAVVAMAQAAWIARSPRDTMYRTASGEDPRPPAKQPRWIIRPEADARWSDVEALLTAHRLSIVSGPIEGRFTIRLDDPGADIAAVKNQLAASPLIAFVGRTE